MILALSNQHLIAPRASHTPLFMSLPPRPCPLCHAPPRGPAFPWESRYSAVEYRYFFCSACSTRYIDPVPDAAAMAAMYGSADYHAEFYGGDGHAPYEETAARLAEHLPAGVRVLDYGCGAGHLIAALKRQGIAAEGAEFSVASAANAAARSGCPVHDLSAPGWRDAGPWEAIHLGDVIEHLPDPRATISELLTLIRPGGLLSAEGPLEANPSPVRATILLFGHIKRLLKPGFVGEFPPYHLLFAKAGGQRAFFARLPGLREVHWRVSENGWPYRRNGALRNAIALAAIALAVLPGLGNRFSVLLRKD